MAEVSLEAINVIAELDQMGWKWESAGGDGAEIRCKCPNPQHEDDNPSCGINVEKKLFKCMVPSCAAAGDFISFLCLALNQPRRVIVELLAERYDFDTTKTVDIEAVERWHTEIWKNATMLMELRKRGVPDVVIRERRLGYDRNRITIPIFNAHGSCVNVRRYLPGAPGPEKMRNMRGHGEVRLYPLDQLKYDTVVVGGGEIKSLATLYRLNKHGIGALSPTAGEGNWEAEFSRLLRGKRVYTCMDIDKAGVDASDAVCARVKGDAKWVGSISLPLDIVTYPKGDVNDYFGPENKTDLDFLRLMEETPEWRAPVRVEEEIPGEAVDLHLAEVTAAVHAGRKVRVRGVVTQKDETPYLVPRKVLCECSRNAEFCAICPVFAKTLDADKGGVELEVRPDSPAILSMIDSPKKAMREATREGLRIPPCKSVVFKTQTHYNVEDVRLTPQLEIGSRGLDSVLRPAYYVGHNLESNAAYEFSGRVYPHPKDQSAVLVAADAAPVADSLDSFKPTDLELQELTLHQPTEWTTAGVQAKLDDRYADLEANVTRIYERRDLHLVVDLVYHTALLIRFDDKQVKGWGEGLIVGDSSQGKSDTVEGLQKHYDLGARMVCKRTSSSGIMGGAVKSGERWFIQWGVVPTNDKRLVILEELKGATTEVIGSLTDMRSSGVAEVTLIEKRKTHARTRLLATSNTRSNRSMDQFPFGVEALVELIGGLEDLRRFDVCYIVSAKQVDGNKLNELQSSRPDITHRHSALLCRRLILWAWTRTPEQIIFQEEATAAIMTGASYLSGQYSDAVPIIDRGSIRYKLARLSVSLAAVTFSCGNHDPHKLVVRKCHVDYVVAFLDRVYGDSTFGYRDFSRAMIAANTLMQPQDLEGKILEVPHVKDFVQALLHTGEIEIRDIQDWCAWEFEPARQLLSLLVRKHALVRTKNSYSKTAGFIEFLKNLQTSGKIEKAQRPDWIKDASLMPREM